MVEVRESRVGVPWTEEETDRLIDGLREGLTVEEIADAVGRTATAIRSRIRLLVPQEAPSKSLERLAWLRVRLREGPYDWRPYFAARVPQPLWSEGRREVLRQAWADGAPGLAQLSADLQFSEQVLVRELIRLGLASSTVEVTDRLGCTPGGVVATRRAWALDSAQWTAHVLVVLYDGAPCHISVHPDSASAHQAKDRVIEANGYSDSSPLTWHIVPRAPGTVDLRQRFPRLEVMTAPKAAPTEPAGEDTWGSRRRRVRAWVTRAGSPGRSGERPPPAGDPMGQPVGGDPMR